MERDIARPGAVKCGSRYTRAGPPQSSGGETNPPRFLMRACSSGRSGLWSRLKSRATTCPLRLPLDAITARESPTHAVYSVPSMSSTTVAVVPDDDVSMVACPSRSSSTRTKVSLSARSGSSKRAGWSSSSACSVFATNCEHESPLSPWPSKHAKRAAASLPANGYDTIPRSWLILAAGAPGRLLGSVPWQLNVPTTVFGKSSSAA
mmetsp:Transcript_6023/g.15406  ORF Transcript_6023/g.15406 Transcript_6023/m.15406 type:complete len:206 (-) Transcript_6023:347-964(-)